MPLIEYRKRYVGGDTTSEIFTGLVGGESKASTVHNALTVAARVFDEDAAEFRGIATAIACDGAQVPFMTLIGACNLAEQFERQAAETREVLALLRGDNEDEVVDPDQS